MSSGAPTLNTKEPGQPSQGGRGRLLQRVSLRRIVAIIGGFLMIAVVSATITAALLVWHGERQIQAVDVETQVPGDVDGDGGVDILVANHGGYGAATPLELWRAGAPASGLAFATTSPVGTFMASAGGLAPASTADAASLDGAPFLCELS